MRARRKKDYILALYEPKGQAIAMRRFLDRPELIDRLGKQSQQLIAEKTLHPQQTPSLKLFIQF
jgi:hypothetical protein